MHKCIFTCSYDSVYLYIYVYIYTVCVYTMYLYKNVHFCSTNFTCLFTTYNRFGSTRIQLTFIPVILKESWRFIYIRATRQQILFSPNLAMMKKWHPKFGLVTAYMLAVHVDIYIYISVCVCLCGCMVVWLICVSILKCVSGMCWFVFSPSITHQIYLYKECIPGTKMTSIFEGQPPKTRPKLQPKQGAPFGFQVYIYLTTQQIRASNKHIAVFLFGAMCGP